MRQVSKKISAAFMQRKSAKCGNTRTDGNTIWLHDNPIARWNDDDSFEVTLAGWGTVTTRERLNSLPAVRVHQHKHEQFITHPTTTCSHMIRDLREWFRVSKLDWERDLFTLNQLGV